MNRVKSMYDFDCGVVLSTQGSYRQRCGYFWGGSFVQCDECKQRYQRYLKSIRNGI